MSAIATDAGTWIFSPSEDEIERTRTAYLAYRISNELVPDAESLLKSIALGFDGDVSQVARFLNHTLLADMPAFEEYQGAVRAQIETLWRHHKLEYIVQMLEFEPLVVWESCSISACMKAPEQVRYAGEELMRLEAEGYALVSAGIEDEGFQVYSWRLRKPKERS